MREISNFIQFTVSASIRTKNKKSASPFCHVAVILFIFCNSHTFTVTAFFVIWLVLGMDVLYPTNNSFFASFYAII